MRAAASLLVGALSLGGAASASPLPPLIRSYEPPGHPQFWAVAQDSRGVLYFGSGDGVLEYDGVSWRSHSLPNWSTGRSLAVGPADEIYVGGQAVFGYLDRESHGQRRFVALSAQLDDGDREFGDVWKTYTTPQGAFFQSSTRIFRWNGRRLSVWKPLGESFHFSYVIGGRFFVLDRGVGLLELRGERLEPVPGGAALAGGRLYGMVGWGEDRALLVSRGRGLFVMEGGSVRPLAAPVNHLLEEARPYHAAVLDDDRVAVATLEGGLLILDRDGHLVEQLDRVRGLPSNRVLYVFQDREGDLWLAVESGLAHLEVSSPLSLYGEGAGIAGTPLAVADHAGFLFVGTQLGLFRLDQTARGPRVPAVEVPGVGSQVFDLREVGSRLLAATTEGVYEIVGGKGRRLTTGVSLCLQLSARWPGVVYVGELDGLRILEDDPGGPMDRGKVAELTADVRTLYEAEDGELWIGSRTSGVYRLQPGKEPTHPERIVRLGGERGLPGGRADVWAVDGEPVFVTAFGVYRFDRSGDTFVPHPWIPSSTDRPTIFVYQDREGRVWRITRPGGESSQPPHYRLEVMLRGGGHSPELDRILDRLRGRTFIAVYQDRSGEVWAFSRNGLVRVDTGRELPSPLPGRPLIRRAVAEIRGSGGSRERQLLPDRAGREAVLPGDTRAVLFEAALPAFADESMNELQAYLEGLEPGWRSWTAEHSFRYMPLPPGSYRFHLRGRDAYRRIGPETVLGFTVARPWFRSPSAYLGGLLLFVGLVWSGHLTRLAQLRRREKQLGEEVTRRTEELKAEEERYRQLFEHAGDTIFVVDPDGVLVSLNRAGERLLAADREQLLGRPLRDLVVSGSEQVLDSLLGAGEGETLRAEVELRAQDGSGDARQVEVRARRVPLRGGGLGLEGVARDVTATRQLELRLRESQRLEAVGRLAGGIAHDFNNLLTVIQGYSALLGERLTVDREALEELGEIETATERAAELTQQLLAFGRKQILAPEPMELGALMKGVEDEVRRTAGAERELQLLPADHPIWVEADPSQLRVVLLHLVANARDATIEGGLIVVESGEVTVKSGAQGADHLQGVPAGRYGRLRVRDRGTGIDEEVLPHLFEPFFTTKGRQRASGLGLATVYGIVRQSGGYVTVQSEPGRGSVFDLLLPVRDAPAIEPVAGPLPEEPEGAAETILVVEDEVAVRRLLVAALRRAGRTVKDCGNPGEALETLTTLEGRLDLLVTDVVMPGMSGTELARAARAARSDLKVLFVSGYAEEAVLSRRDLGEATAFLQKPFAVRELLEAVDRLLRGRNGPPSSSDDAD